MRDNDRRIGERLRAKGVALFSARPTHVEFTRHDEADALLNDLEGHPHAYLLACIMDRQLPAEIAWMVPFRLKERIGDFRFRTLQALSPTDFERLFREPDPLHRFPKVMAENARAAIQLVERDYGGDASSIWSGSPHSAEVVFRFLQFRGVGPKIATMATNILARDFKVPFSDYYSVDVSVDVHVRRVFRRLGLIRESADQDEIIYRARAISPDFPGLLDFPAWEVGRTWCRPSKPLCSDCYLSDLCPFAKA